MKGFIDGLARIFLHSFEPMSVDEPGWTNILLARIITLSFIFVPLLIFAFIVVMVL